MLQIVTCSDLVLDLDELYTKGLPQGSSTGWRSVNDLYTVAPGFWTIVTGVPSHGKSTWMDNLMLNLMKQGWKFIVYSPENQPHALYLAHLMEKYLRKPFRSGFHGRMEPSDIARATDFLETRLRILKFDGGAAFPTLNTIMFTAHEILQEWMIGPVGVICDPWNELDHSPLAGLNETQMVNHELMVWRQWIRDHGDQVHGWIIAHPQKPARGKNGEPRPVGLYDINGSAAYYNKCDMGIVIRRKDDDQVEIEVEKSRFRHLGKKGSAYLNFNSGTGTYEDAELRGGSYRTFDQEGDPF